MIQKGSYGSKKLRHSTTGHIRTPTARPSQHTLAQTDKATELTCLKKEETVRVTGRKESKHAPNSSGDQLRRFSLKLRRSREPRRVVEGHGGKDGLNLQLQT
ncbi:hypothetical protein E2C01_023566 [Portunus trituberculatus]|uniref:Uncharacterized protein n=1 Tax=Portunus trituberculatus TaxID=210409 RepID=A0A5B7EAE0_PORTR|nr:hypothetical protein [Portunus trituberculatus]